MNNVVIAPNVEELKAENTAFINDTKSSIAFYGCGGFGINMIHNNLAALEGYGIQTVTFDTSKANSANIPDTVAQYFVCDEGSGKVRASNLDRVQKVLHDHPVLRDLADINVIMFSLSGGSGSIIGPLLAKAIAQKNKAVVILTVADNSCRMETMNTIKTIQTLQNLAESNGHYYPLMLFCNMGNGRSSVNTTISNKLNIFLDIFASDNIKEIDKSDRINFLTPNKYASAPSGMYIFDMLKEGVGMGPEDVSPGELDLTIEQNQVCHSVFSANPEGSQPGVVPLVSYTGICDDHEYIACTGIPIPMTFLNEFKSSLDSFNSKNIPTQNVNSFDFGMDDDALSSGIII